MITVHKTKAVSCRHRLMRRPSFVEPEREQLVSRFHTGPEGNENITHNPSLGNKPVVYCKTKVATFPNCSCLLWMCYEQLTTSENTHIWPCKRMLIVTGWVWDITRCVDWINYQNDSVGSPKFRRTQTVLDSWPDHAQLIILIKIIVNDTHEAQRLLK